jgi:tetratricopeptide (TPR) repeat protein
VPSRLALELIAKRLKMQPEELAAAATVTSGETDMAALEEDLAYQLNYAKLLQRENRLADAFALIDEAEVGTLAYRDSLPGHILYRIPLTRGRAYLLLQEYGKGQEQLAEALDAAKGNIVAATTVRNLMGSSFYEEEKPDLALQWHLQCLRALQSGAVKDPNLRLSILRNIGLDYYALNDMPSSIRFYKESLDALQDLDDPEREAAVHWGISRAYQDQGNIEYARLHVKKAMDIYEKLKMPLEWA